MSEDAPDAMRTRVSLTVAPDRVVTVGGKEFGKKGGEYKEILDSRYYKMTGGRFVLEAVGDSKKPATVDLKTRWLIAVDIVLTEAEQLVVIGHYEEGGIPHELEFEPDLAKDYRCIECSGVIVCGVNPSCVPVTAEIPG